jgi:hypothetical protein
MAVQHEMLGADIESAGGATTWKRCTRCDGRASMMLHARQWRKTKLCMARCMFVRQRFSNPMVHARYACVCVSVCVCQCVCLSVWRQGSDLPISLSPDALPWQLVVILIVPLSMTQSDFVLGARRPLLYAHIIVTQTCSVPGRHYPACRAWRTYLSIGTGGPP